MPESEFSLAKRPTRIPGLDAATRGGLPAAGGILILGGPGSGKTILVLQILAHAVEHRDGGVFVSFEESTSQIERDADSFTWGPQLLSSDRCQIIDARPSSHVAASGDFDLEGLIALIGASLDRIGGSWIVLDGIDHLLRLQPDERLAADEVRRLSDWCEQRHVTLLLTGKKDPNADGRPAYLGGVEYLLSTVLTVSTELVNRRLNRRFRIAKYRGTGHVNDELPMVIDGDGLHLPYGLERTESPALASRERVSTGIPQLDEVLGGGLLRGSATLISGEPGTAKTTLAASIACAAAERDERVLYLSFDELADRIARNAGSVGIELQPHLDGGRIYIESRAAWSALVEEHFIAIEHWLSSLQPQWLVIDPVSALLKAVSAEGAYMSTERILGLARDRGITCVLTSLTDAGGPETEATLSHTSTLADTWISLDYRILGGERNRALSVVKSRGSAHSNQVRELLLSSDGVALAEVYEHGSEVLMGTARVLKEHEVAADKRRRATERDQRQRDLERHLEQAQIRIRESQSEAARLEEELQRQRQGTTDTDRETREQDEGVQHQRSGSAGKDESR
ncbi:MAG: ATPase domain-containing protein [Halofilum sp. (in: g-proteobacteria)]